MGVPASSLQLETIPVGCRAAPSARIAAADDLAPLAAGVVLGELFVLRLEDRSSVPLSFAVMIRPLALSFAAGVFASSS